MLVLRVYDVIIIIIKITIPILSLCSNIPKIHVVDAFRIIITFFCIFIGSFSSLIQSCIVSLASSSVMHPSVFMSVCCHTRLVQLYRKILGSLIYRKN